MKIALIYSGNLRTWDQCKPNHKDTFGDQDVYGYFFTDRDPTETNHIQDKRPRVYQWVQYHQSLFDDPFGEHKFNSRKAPENTAHQTLNQWHSSYIGFHLVPRKYDVYVRVRCDIKFNGPLDFSRFDYLTNNIYIPEGMNYGGVNDQFAFGNYEVMRIYYSVFLNCYQLFDDGVLFHSETMQMENLKRNGVNIVRFGSPQHDLIR